MTAGPSTRPTHRLKADGSLVWPDGYPASAIEALPDDHYAAGDLVEAERALIASVDRKRAAMRATVMTRGEGQSYAYAQKAAEVRDYHMLGGAIVAALSVEQCTARFPFAAAEAVATGEAIADVIAGFESGMAASQQCIATVEAVAVQAKRAIRAATTIATKQAAADAAPWPA